ncbi:MAG: ribonuclease P protein component [Christensenellales bacterium]
MGRDYMLRRNKEFQYVYRRGKSLVDRNLVLLHLSSKTIKTGFCVSKKVGNSVCRNRIRRQMREAFHSLLPYLNAAQMVFVARSDIINSDYWQIRSSMIRLLRKAGLLRGEHL